jgi:amino acid transporter
MNSHSFPDEAASSITVTDKGLRKNALSFLSNIVIGVASAAPAYSLASALGPIAGSASFATPAIMIAAFIPMLFIAVAYYWLNRVDPDCGTTFSWVTLAMGPQRLDRRLGSAHHQRDRYAQHGGHCRPIFVSALWA